jgi:hypothetical protein
VEHGYWEQKGLTSTLTDQGPYEFVVSGTREDYIDLAYTYLFVEAQITKTDGSPWTSIPTWDPLIYGFEC